MALGQGQPDPMGRFRLARQVILFLLGVVVIIDGIASSGTPVPEIVTGLVLIGYVPLDDLMSRLPRASDFKHPECKATPESPPQRDMPPATTAPPTTATDDYYP